MLTDNRRRPDSVEERRHSLVAEVRRRNRPVSEHSSSQRTPVPPSTNRRSPLPRRHSGSTESRLLFLFLRIIFFMFFIFTTRLLLRHPCYFFQSIGSTESLSINSRLTVHFCRFFVVLLYFFPSSFALLLFFSCFSFFLSCSSQRQYRISISSSPAYCNPLFHCTSSLFSSCCLG